MPSAFTAAVVDGEIDDFKSFAWHCARAFMYYTRDANEGDGRYRRPADNLSERYSSKEYHENSLERVKTEHQVKLNRTDDEWKTYASQLLQEEQDRYQERLEDFNVENDRIQRMKGKVECWTPPTENHENMKKFMLQQLEESVPPTPRQPDPAEYEWESLKDMLIKSSARQIEFHEERIQSSQDVKEQNLAWLNTLDDSIEALSEVVDK